MISSGEVNRTLTAVRRSGAAADIEATLRPVRAGRPRAVSAEVFLAALMLTARHKKAMTLTAVHEILTRDIPVSTQIELGTRGPRKGSKPGQPITIRQVRYVLEAIEKRLAYTPERVKELPQEVRESRQQALQDILDKLLDGVMPVGIEHNGSYALDETGVWAWGRGKKARSGSSAGGAEQDEDKGSTPADPDARWGRKTAKGGGDEMYFGYGVYALTRIPEVGQPSNTAPILTERIIVRPAAKGEIEPSLAGIDSLRKAGRNVNEVVCDRGFSYKVATSWADQLRARGITQVMDIHPSDQRVMPHQGVAMVDGAPHCPGTPQELLLIQRPKSLGQSDELDAFIEASDTRAQFALRPVGKGRKDGDTRWQCPALAGKVRCALRDISAGFDESLPKAQNPAKSAAPKCCTQETITVPAKAQAKLRQQHYYGSTEWVKSYKRRTYVEGAFGNLKNRNTENLTRGWAQVMGIVKTSIMLAAAAAAANLRLLRAWAAKTGDITDPLAKPDPSEALFEELDPATGAATPTGPPAAA